MFVLLKQFFILVAYPFSKNLQISNNPREADIGKTVSYGKISMVVYGAAGK